MKNILQEIENRSAQIESGYFCQWLIDESVEDKFYFVSSMVFLVFGFKDILNFLKTENPTNDLQKSINIHCEEDLDHWKWYLYDLNYLGFNVQSWGPSVTNIFETIWDDQHEPFRQIVYKSIHFAKTYPEPELQFVIIEVLEAVFGSFIKYMRVPVKQSGLYPHLRYFGQTHIEKEESHALHHEKEHEDCLFEKIIFTPQQQADALKIVHNLFDEFDKVFARWGLEAQRRSKLSSTVIEKTSPHLPDFEESPSL